jgi:hypothetical protein
VQWSVVHTSRTIIVTKIDSKLCQCFQCSQTLLSSSVYKSSCMNRKKLQLDWTATEKDWTLQLQSLRFMILTSCSSLDSTLQLDCHWTGCNRLQPVLVLGISHQFSELTHNPKSQNQLPHLTSHLLPAGDNCPILAIVFMYSCSCSWAAELPPLPLHSPL